MKILSKWRDTIYNKVWHSPKGKLRNFLKTKCDEMPHNRRMVLVAVLFGAFVIVAFFLFGNACYRIGLGHAQQRIQNIEHINAVELTTQTEDIPTLTLDDI